MLHIIGPNGKQVSIRCLTDQVYSMEDEQGGGQWHWNVSEGRRLAEARGELFTISLQQLGVTVEFIRRQYHDMDEAYALTTDLSQPLLFVPFGGKDQLVDGWNRLFKAAFLGVDELLAYFLTAEEADACLLCQFPPGQGVDWGQKAVHPTPSETSARRRQRRSGDRKGGSV